MPKRGLFELRIVGGSSYTLGHNPFGQQGGNSYTLSGNPFGQAGGRRRKRRRQRGRGALDRLNPYINILDQAAQGVLGKHAEPLMNRGANKLIGLLGQ